MSTLGSLLMRKEIALSIYIAATLLVPMRAFAEVSDKVVSIPEVWLWSGLGAVVAYAASRYRLWAGLLVSPAAALVSGAAIATVMDPHVGPAVVEEQGWPYVATAYGSLGSIVLAVVAGTYLRRSSRSRVAG